MHAWLREGIEHYADRHDRLAGGTSVLSPYLHFGCVSARELEQRAGRHDAYTRQLAWRDFYAHVLLHHPGNARHAYRRELDGIEWDGEDAHFDAWREGRTGYPVVDAGMRQLAATGWMHNRARLITACFLVKDLHIDWRRGEQHFMRLLLDGDQANNNGNWQWISSVGVDPAPLHRRLYNPVLQQQRHDPDGEYVRRWVPELEDIPLEQLATPWEAGGPEPIVDHAVERRRTLAAYARRPRLVSSRRNGGLHASSLAGRSRSPPRRASSPAGRPGRARSTTTQVRLDFLVDDWSGPAHVVLRQADGVVRRDRRRPTTSARAIAQAARIVSLDHDGSGYPEVGERDPIVGELQRASGYLRPVLFHSPYEAAAWSVISARTQHAQADEAARRAVARTGSSRRPSSCCSCASSPGLPGE